MRAERSLGLPKLPREKLSFSQEHPEGLKAIYLAVQAMREAHPMLCSPTEWRGHSSPGWGSLQSSIGERDAPACERDGKRMREGAIGHIALLFPWGARWVCVTPPSLARTAGHTAASYPTFNHVEHTYLTGWAL